MGILKLRVSNRARITFGAAALGLALLGAVGDAATPPGATSSARAFAVSVVVPGQPGASTPVIASPPAGQSLVDGFKYPADGSVVQTGAITATTSATSAGVNANASAGSDVSAVSLFHGEITADGLSGRAKAVAAAGSAGGDVAGTNVVNLVVLGQQVQPAANLRVQLADWGYVDVLAQRMETTAPKGVQGRHFYLTALDVHVTADHGGVPAGSEILIGYVEAAAQTAPPAARPKPPRPPSTGGHRRGMHDERANAHSKKGAQSPEAILRKQSKKGLKVTPELSGGPYVFPVFGSVDFGDTFGGPRSDVSNGYHHGDDIFGQIGQPILAVADGTLFEVGFEKIGGYRLWLRDRQGNQFYYAHLSAYSAAARNGAHVKAGAVIAFMGTTGDAFGSPAHLHFEVHPVSLLFLGYDGAVNPTSYLNSWRRLDEIRFPFLPGWAPPIRGSVRAPEPGAVLLGGSDISTADGLDPASLRKAFRTPFLQTPAETPAATNFLTSKRG